MNATATAPLMMSQVRMTGPLQGDSVQELAVNAGYGISSGFGASSEGYTLSAKTNEPTSMIVSYSYERQGRSANVPLDTAIEGMRGALTPDAIKGMRQIEDMPATVQPNTAVVTLFSQGPESGLYAFDMNTDSAPLRNVLDAARALGTVLEQHGTRTEL